jgi:hypothetical protein
MRYGFRVPALLAYTGLLPVLVTVWVLYVILRLFGGSLGAMGREDVEPAWAGDAGLADARRGSSRGLSARRGRGRVSMPDRSWTVRGCGLAAAVSGSAAGSA